MRDDAHTEIACPHEGGMYVQMLDDGAIPSPWGEGRAKRAGEGSAVLRFIRPDGTVIDSVPKTSGDWTQLPLQHENGGIHISARTAATRWARERCDYGLGIEVMMSQHKRARYSKLAVRSDFPRRHVLAAALTGA